MVFLEQYKMLTIALQQQKNLLPVYHLLRILRPGNADVCTCNIIFLWHFYSHVESTYYDPISSLREEACAHKISLTPPLYIFCIMGIALHLSTILLLNFGTVPTIWFVFHFISTCSLLF